MKQNLVSPARDAPQTCQNFSVKHDFVFCNVLCVSLSNVPGQTTVRGQKLGCVSSLPLPWVLYQHLGEVTLLHLSSGRLHCHWGTHIFPCCPTPPPPSFLEPATVLSPCHCSILAFPPRPSRVPTFPGVSAPKSQTKGSAEER